MNALPHEQMDLGLHVLGVDSLLHVQYTSVDGLVSDQT